MCCAWISFLLPALSTVVPCHGQQLCSQLSVDESTSPVFSCFIPFRSLSETKKYKVSRLVAYSDSCPAFVSSSRDLDLSATGTCGGGGVAGPDCLPVFSSRVSLQGAGLDYDQYTHLFEAVAQTRFYTGLWFCITLSEAYTSWSQPAWNCRQMYPGDECPPAPMEPFGGINSPPVASNSGSFKMFAACSIPRREISPAGAEDRPSSVSSGELRSAEMASPSQREHGVKGMTRRQESRRWPGSGSSTQP